MCLQYELRKSVNENVQKSSYLDQLCESTIDDNGLNDHISYMEQTFGSFDNLTCRAFTGHDFKLFLLNIITLTNQNDQEFKNEQIYELSTCLHANLNAAVQCITKRIYNYQEGQQINVDGNCLVKIGQQLIKNLRRPPKNGIIDHCLNKQIINPINNWFAEFNNPINLVPIVPVNYNFG